MVIRLITNTLMTLIMLTLFSTVSFADVKVSADRNPVTLDESFKLTFDVTGTSGDDPDFKPLEKDFQILSTSQNSYFSMQNGTISSSKQWTLLLMATAAGKFQIPSIKFGNDQSPVVDIEVKEESSVNDVSGSKDEYVFLEATASSTNPYVQSQVLYKLKLLRSVNLGKAQLSDPEVTKGTAVIDRLDEDQTYESVINGKTWQVIERNFAIYPQSSGTVTISPVKFMGQVSGNSYGYDPFGPAPRTIIRRSAEIVLDVRAIPAAFTGTHWLPAENLNIAEQWSTDPSKLKKGEPVTRTLTMNATGLTASQLPELPAWNQSDLKYYPDQPVLNDDKKSTGITGTRSEKAAIIPNQPGSFVLPEVSIPWWNTKTDKLEFAVVPEHTLQVESDAANANAPVNIPSQAAQQPTVIASEAKSATTPVAPEASVPVPVPQHNYWITISAALFILWVTTLFIWWQKTRGVAAAPISLTGNKGRISHAAKQVLDACKRNDAQQVRLQLLQWGQLVWFDKPPVSLGDISHRCSSAMAEQIRIINDALYSPGGKDWSGNDLAKVFSNESTPATNTPAAVNQGKLEPLYRL